MLAAALLVLLTAIAAGLGLLHAGRPRSRAGARLAVGTWFALAMAGAVGLIWRSGTLRLVTPVGSVGWHVDPWVAGWLMVVGLMGGFAVSARAAAGAVPGEMIAVSWLAVGVAGILTAADALTLVLAWGLLTASAYGAVVAGAHRARVLAAGWVLLVMNELGTAALIVGAILLTTQVAVGPVADVAALLGLLGLGAKTGLFPFQVWLPVAEPEAPGVVAGVLSGVTTAVVMVALGQWYGWTHPDLTVGWITVGLGVVGGALGAVHAALDHDLKRVLAYSTVEWMGLATALLGLSVVFLRTGAPAPAGVALAAFYAVALMHLGAKTAAFGIAGWVEQAGAGRRLDALGGLYRRAGWLARWALLAVIALMALPPTGGYLAEWLSLESVFMESAGPLKPPLLVVGILLALLAATGATAMLRWYGAVFLGPPRGRKLPRRPDAGSVRLVGAGAVLAAVAGVGVGWWLPFAARWAPPLVGQPVLRHLVARTFGAHPAPALLVSLGGRVFAGLPGAPGAIVFPGPGFTAIAPWYLLWFGGAMVLGVAWARRAWMRRHQLTVRREAPWSGGSHYRREHAWTATALTHPLRLAFAPVIRLTRRRQEGAVVRVDTDIADRLLEQGMRPVQRWVGRIADALAQTESGLVSHYVLYVLAALAVGLLALGLHAG
ncbi:MAG: proton-conducting transporter membrane subunit [Thermaerobacter sp.]|nr:proton-conducting transporter membrane subunit [Thermaerobacter sp.]